MSAPIDRVVVPPNAEGRPLVVVQAPRRRFSTWLLMLILLMSVALNLILFSAWHSYFGYAEGVVERFHSGDAVTTDRIALITVEGTIMPPFTGHVLKAIEQASKDDNVKGVVLVVDSPGGLVADSNEIYHALRKLETEKHKPINVSMKRLAASGGYYVSMGAGPEGVLFAEPTCWTGSIGVILPHYDVSGLAEKLGVKEDSLKTGPYKDTLTLFKPVSEVDKKLWMEILDEMLDRFLDVIAGSRKGLDVKKIREMATGQVFTAKQAKERKLVDQIGFLDDAIKSLKERLNLKTVRVVSYETPPNFFERLVSSSESAAKPEMRWNAILESAVPRAYYLFTSLPGIAPR
jgi:protease IV